MWVCGGRGRGKHNLHKREPFSLHIFQLCDGLCYGHSRYLKDIGHSRILRTLNKIMKMAALTVVQVRGATIDAERSSITGLRIDINKAKFHIYLVEGVICPIYSLCLRNMVNKRNQKSCLLLTHS